MKRVTTFHLRTILALVAICFVAMGTTAWAQLFDENFSYSTGQLTNLNAGANVSGGTWVTFSGSGNAIQVSSGSLSYAGYASSGIGNKIDIISTATSAEDAYRAFTTQTTGETYVAFMLNLANTTGLSLNSSTTGDYLGGYAVSASTSFVNRISIRLGSVAGTYQLGIRASSAATVGWYTTDLSPGTTYLVVMSHEIIGGAANDIGSLWVNPTLGGSEPAANATSTSGADPVDLGKFFVRQGTTTTPNASIDGIRVATSWADAAAQAPFQYRSANSGGNWNSTGSWDVSTDGGSSWAAASLTPTSSDGAITIRSGHPITVTASVMADQLTVESGATLAVSSGQTLTIANGTGTDCTVNGTLSTAGTVTNSGTIAVNGGAFQIDEGGWGGTTGTYSYDATGRLVFNNSSGYYGLGSSAAFWPEPISNVTVQNTGGLELQTDHEVTGTFQTSTGVRNTFGNDLTISGTCQINSGGFFDNFSPTYTAGATLVYNSGGTFGNDDEWTGSGAAGYGIPGFVNIQNSTTVNLAAADRSTGGLQVLSGTLNLNATSGNLSVGIDLNNQGTINQNGRTITFSGTGGVLWNNTGGSTYGDIVINKTGGGSVNLVTDVPIDGALTLTEGLVNAGSNTLNLGASATYSRTNGYVTGNVKKTFSGAGSFSYPIGTANGYSPVDVVAASGGDLTAKATQGAHGSPFSANSLQRYWTLTNGGLTSADLTFHYIDPTDISGTEASYSIRKRSGSIWTSPGGTVDATNNEATITGVTSFSDWTLAECPTLTMTPAAGALTGGNQGIPYSETFVASNGQSPYSYAVTSGSLPGGLSLASNGSLTGTPSAPGSFAFNVTATDTAGCMVTQSYTLDITGCPVITLTPSTLPNGGGIGAAYSQFIVASGGQAPYTWSITSGALPGGISLTTVNDSTVQVSGNFSADGVFNFTLEAEDANTCTGDNAYTLVVCQDMTFSLLNDGTIGAAYSDTITNISGGTGPYTYVLNSGALPTGLSLATSGAVTGTPSATGTFIFDVDVTDANGCTDLHMDTINITCPTINVSPATLPNGKVSTAYSQTVTATSGSSPYTFAITSGSLPTGLALASGGGLTGTPTVGGSYTFQVTATDANSCTGVRSYTIVIDAPVTFKIAAGPSRGNEGPAGTMMVDTLDWRNKAIWVMSGADADSIPDDDDVVLDNTYRSGSYVLRVGTVGPDSCRTITVGYPGNTNEIRIVIPKSSTVSNALKFGTNGPGNYDMVIDQGGIVENSSGRTSGTALNIRGFSSVGDSVLIKPGGKYLHRAKVSASGILIGMSKDINTAGGTVEFDIYGNATTARFVTMAGTVFGNLVFSATDSAIVYNPSTSQASAFGSCFIKGNLIVNPGATFITGTAGGYEEDFFIRGNLINNGGTFSFGAINTPVLIGPSAQTVTGAVTFGKGLFVANSAGVSLASDATVTGGSVQTTGTINYRQPQFPTNIFPISAAGVLNTGSSTIYLNPSGSLSEGTNPIQGNVSATRTASTGVNQTFGNIGYEINAAGSAPGVTTVFRKTGVASSGNGNPSITRYFDVSPTVNAALNATVGFSYDDSELNGITEANLLLHKSTDGGTTWSGKTGSVNTVLNKITATGVNSMSRWTAASSTAPMFITHTVTIRKFADADGDINTSGDQTAKKWRMSLYRDSVDAGSLIVSANPNSGVIVASNLEAGTYIAVEEDSVGWLHLGNIHNGTPVVTSSRYDTLTVSGGNPGTVDFVNQQVSSITVNKVKDTDGDANTTGDQTPKQWYLAIYKDAVAAPNLISDGNVSTLTANNIQAGTYIAVEADSGASWSRINGNGTRYDTLVVPANSALSTSFINFRPNSITVRKFQDNDGDFNTTGDRVLKAWTLEVHTGSVSGPVIASGNVNTLAAGDLGDDTYYVTEADSGWIRLGYILNGTPVAGNASSVTIALADGQNATVDFVNAPGIYAQSFRSFSPDSIALDKDNKGKVNKLVKRKADKVDVKLKFQAPRFATGFKVKFSMAFTGYIYTDTTKTVILDSVVNAKEKIVTVAVDSLHWYQLEGFGWKGKQIKTEVHWTSLPKVTKVKYLEADHQRNVPKYPMPNRVNALEEVYSQGGFASTLGLKIGRDRSTPTDSSKFYGWVIHKKYTDVLKSLNAKGTLHTGSPKGLSTYLSGKPILKKQGSMPPTKQDNKLVADLIALRFNIVASMMEKTPLGFGELIYDDSASIGGYVNILDGMSVKDIADFGDSVVMGYWSGGSHVFFNDSVYQVLHLAASRINNAFEGPLDTLDFTSKLHFSGSKQLIEVPYLKADQNAIPAKLIPTNGVLAERPEMFELYQNYPNPFNPTTTIEFELLEEAVVTLKVFNMLGQEVATLIDREEMTDGFNSIDFDANTLSTGVYFYRLTAEGLGDPEEGITGQTFVTTKKMMLMK